MTAKKYLFIGFVLSFAALVSGCVTETKVEEAKPFIATVPPEVAVKATTPPRGEAIPGSIVVKCRVRFDKDPSKNHFCGSSTVKVLNEVTKSSKDYNFKGDKLAIPVVREASYGLQVRAQGCETAKNFNGLTMGMVLTVQFENCGEGK